MPQLATHIRKQLEATAKKARAAAEAGARKALEALAVERARPHESMGEDELELRRRLRAHGRQLGDRRDEAKDTQETRRLERETAYEHWHRMLFARFLAENHLLVEPTSGVAISLEECGELARESGEDMWAFAGRCAQRMLPRIFRADDPVLAVALPPETRQALEKLLAELPVEVFTADDSLGWTYQFWQAAEKDAVNERAKSGEKITGETLPAVTQLFTEHYMVLFLLHNTLGAWHAGKVLAAKPELARDAASEAELRRAVALPGIEWEYLRFVRTPLERDADDAATGPWRPAGGAFETWPKTAAKLRVLDPCCGSGHFLVAALELLAALRMHEEGLDERAALRAVLEYNLFGLELDARCTQIAAFNLAFTVWKRLGGVIELPRLSIACCGIGPSTTKDEWLELAEAAARAGGMPVKRDLFGKEESLLSDAMRSGFEALYELFARAPELGSLIDPTALKSDLYQARFADIEPLLARMLSSRDDETRERAVAAAGMARAAQILRPPPGGYTLVVTNVPYLGRKSHTDEFKAWVDAHYKDAKNDLATVFVVRMLRWVGQSGTIAAVTPQNWLFLTGYRKLRQQLLEKRSWSFVARLGAGAFETIGGHVVNVALVTITAAKPTAEQLMAGIDVSGAGSARGKADALRGESVVEEVASRDAPPIENSLDTDDPDSDADETADASTSADGVVRVIPQADQLKRPSAEIALRPAGRVSLLLESARSYQGLSTGDDFRLRRQFWETRDSSAPTDSWFRLQAPSNGSGLFAGRESVVAAAFAEGSVDTGALRGRGAWKKCGVAIDRVGSLSATLYAGDYFHSLVPVLIPNKPSDLAAVLEWANSPSLRAAARETHQGLSIDNGYFERIAFDLAHWQRVAAERYPDGLPEPQSNDPTQWLFHGHPAGMLAAGPAERSPFGVADPIGVDRHPSLICREPNLRDVLQVAVARLLGYRWPAEHDAAMKLDIAARAWVDECSALAAHADDDGIVCLASVRGEPTAADRLRKLLTAAFAHVPGGFTATRERELLAAAAGDSKPVDTLEDWLQESFFEQHCTLFHSRPFVWHVWDGRADGFNCLVNYHRLAGSEGEGRRTLELLVYTYLGEWIERQKSEQAEGREGADGRLNAARKLHAEFEAILQGEPPYDLFVRWKPLHEQPLGWTPDINDGVRLNIRPFLLAADVGRKDSGILRARPKGLKWKKGEVDKSDRGKEPQSIRPRSDFPWFWSCSPLTTPAHRTNFGAPLADAPPAGATFDGVRWNDLHYTRAAKEAARAQRDRSERT